MEWQESIRHDVLRFVDVLESALESFSGGIPVPLQVEFYHDKKQVQHNGSWVFEEEEEEMCDWNDSQSLMTAHARFVLDLLRVQTPKRLGSFLRNLVMATDEIDAIIAMDTNALAFGIVQQAYDAFEHQKMMQRTFLREVNRPIVRIGGGSGAGFQVYCDEELLLNVGGGSGGGMELNYKFEGMNSFGGGGGGGIRLNANETIRMHVGGGGGGGATRLSVFQHEETMYHYKVDEGIEARAVVARAKQMVQQKAQACIANGRKLWVDGGGGGGGGSQVSDTNYCGFGYGFAFFSPNVTALRANVHAHVSGGLVQDTETTSNASEEIQTNDQGKITGDMFKKAAALCNGYKHWECVCTTGRSLLMQHNISWATGMTCDHQEDRPTKTVMEYAASNFAVSNLDQQMRQPNDHYALYAVITIVMVMVVAVRNHRHRRQQYVAIP